MTNAASEHHFEAEITGHLSMNADALRERVYETANGMVRVSAQWPEPNEDEPSMRVPLEVFDEREPKDARDLPAFVELYFHDAFLLMNVAAPGSFGGIVSTTGGEFAIRELTFDSNWFEAVARGAQTIPLAEVVAWYDGQKIGTQQVASTPIAQALFHLLHIARYPGSMWLAVLHLARAAEALHVTSGEASGEILELLESIAGGGMPVLHPMQDELLDPRAEENEGDLIAAMDAAMRAIVAALQSDVRRA